MQSSSNCPKDDVVFCVDEGPDLDTGCSFRSGGPLEIELRIDRYVGPVDANGHLLTPFSPGITDTLVLNISAWDVDYYGAPPPDPRLPERDAVYLNGQFLGFLRGNNEIWYNTLFAVPTDLLVFPDKAAPGDTLVPAVNNILVDINILEQDDWCTAVDYVAVRVPAPLPVLLLNGWFPIQEPLDQLWSAVWAPQLTTAKVPHEAFYLSRTAFEETNAQSLQDFVPSFKKRYGVNRFNVVAHSKGGLDASQYLQWRDDVSTLITLGTPYLGSNWQAVIVLANLFNWQLGFPFENALALSFLSSYRTKVMNEIWKPSPNTRYVTRAGNVLIPDPFRLFLDDYTYHLPTESIDLVELHSDVLVPVSSANGLPPSYSPEVAQITSLNAPHWFLTRDEEAAQDLTSRYLAKPYVPPSGGFSPAVETVANFGPLRSSEFASKGDNSEATSVQSSAIDSTQHTAMIVGEIDQGGTNSHVVDIDATTAIYLVTGWTEGELDVTLTDPNATTIDSAVTSTDLDMAYIAYVDSATGIRHANYLINYPAEGEWTVEVDGTSVPPDGSSYFIQGSFLVPDISLIAQTDRAYYRNSEPVTISAHLTNLGSGVGNATVGAKIIYPDSTVYTVAVPVKSKNQGLYEVTLDNLTQPTLYGIQITGSGVIGHGQSQKSFSRQTFTTISMAETTSEFTGSISDGGVDTDGDGLFDELKIQIGVDATASGGYAVRGKLVDGNGDVLGYARSDTSLSSGSHSVELLFDGGAIFDRHLDGPYTLTDVVLVEVDSLTLMLDELDSPYSTQSYEYTEFQHASVSVYGTNASVKDTDGDGVYNQLNFQLLLDSEIDTDCSFTGALMDPGGHLIEQQEKTIHTFQNDVGTRVYLIFDGRIINDRGLDGPYSVDLYYSCTQAGSSRFVIGAAVTDEMSSTQFGTPMDVLWSSDFDLQGLDGAVRAIAIGPNDEVYVGGDFTEAGGVTVNHLAKYENGSWSALGGGTDAPVRALAIAGNGDLYVGGEFSLADTVAAKFIAKWNGTQWSALGSGAQSWVLTVDTDGNGNVYAGGSFLSAGGVSANRIAKWDGSAWSALGSGASSTVRALRSVGSTLYVGGDFTSTGGTAALHVAKWVDGTSTWSAVGGGLAGPVYSITRTASGFILAGGNFIYTGGGLFSLNISRWNGAIWAAPDKNLPWPTDCCVLDAPVYSLFTKPGTDDVYIGGAFDRTWGPNGVLHGVGIFHNVVNGGFENLGSGVSDSLGTRTVRAIAVDSDGNTYVGGEFDRAGQKPSYYFGVFETQSASKGQKLRSGWNTLANTKGARISIEKLLAGISESVKVAQDEQGFTYWPEIGVNDIGTLESGEAYRVFLEAEAAFRDSGVSTENTTVSESKVAATHYSVPPLNIDHSAVLMVLSDLGNGDEIAVRTEAGELVGSGIVHDGRAAMTLWGEVGPETRGAAEGEALVFTGWSVVRQSEIPLQMVANGDLAGNSIIYTPDAIQKVSVAENVVPSSFELYANYPNPFNAQTSIRFDVPTESKVSLEVFNVMGQRVETLVDDTKRPGIYVVSFDARRLASGPYYYRLTASDKVVTRRMMVVR